MLLIEKETLKTNISEDFFFEKKRICGVDSSTALQT